MKAIAEYYADLVQDPLRSTLGFSPEMELFNTQVLAASKEGSIAIMKEWLARHQPCLFGRIAAREDLLSFCVLTEEDFQLSDDHILSRIQAERTEWTRLAFEGRKSGFVILAISERLALAAPNDSLKEFAQRLTSLYLLREIELNQIYLEDVYLEQPSHRRTTWRWDAGVNYFATNADRRWWQDHRIPGGIALSVNSVGHMAKSGMIASSQRALEKVTAAPTDGTLPTKIDSLHQALEFAMRTIQMASDAVSGKATRLLSTDGSSVDERCPIDLPRNLAGKSCADYEGYYHTDVTLPSLYFRPDIERPSEAPTIQLDFTYLWKEGAANPANQTMGVGRLVRRASPTRLGAEELKADSRPPNAKASRAQPSELSLSACPRLMKAIDTIRTNQ